METQTVGTGNGKPKTKSKREDEGTDQLVGKNEGVTTIVLPYAADVELVGRDPILLHRYDCAEVKDKGAAAKGSKKKKEDNIESYVYRDEKTGEIGLPGFCLKACLADAAKYIQDPRSPRKCARDLVRASVRIGGFASFGTKEWDFIDRRRAVVQRNGITRARPAMQAGWTLRATIEVIDPEYVQPGFLHDLLHRAGVSCGLGDYRPDFGTFRIAAFRIVELT